VRTAQARAIQIEQRAEQEALTVRDEAEKYAGMLLTRVQERLEQALSNVRAGLRELETGDIAPR
jgi:hypothetical protein